MYSKCAAIHDILCRQIRSYRTLSLIPDACRVDEQRRGRPSHWHCSRLRSGCINSGDCRLGSGLRGLDLWLSMFYMSSTNFLQLICFVTYFLHGSQQKSSFHGHGSYLFQHFIQHVASWQHTEPVCSDTRRKLSALYIHQFINSAVSWTQPKVDV